MDDVTVADLARTVLGEVAPEQLDRFPLVLQAYRASPGAARRAHRDGDRPTATGPMIAGEAMAALTLAVGVELANEAVGGGVAGGWWRRLRRRTAGPDSAFPRIAEPDVPALRARVKAICLSRNASEAAAVQVSDVFAAKAPRATKG